MPLNKYSLTGRNSQYRFKTAMSDRQDLTFEKGATWEINGIATKGDGTVIDLTAATINWRIYNATTGATVDTRTTGGSGIVVDSAAAGTYTATLTPAQQTSASIAAQTTYKYRLWVVTSGSAVYDQLQGYLYSAVGPT